MHIRAYAHLCICTSLHMHIHAYTSVKRGLLPRQKRPIICQKRPGIVWTSTPICTSMHPGGRVHTYMCMHVYVCIHVHVCVHVCVHCASTYTRACTQTRIFILHGICVTNVYVYVYASGHLCRVCACVCVYIRASVSHMCMCIHQVTSSSLSRAWRVLLLVQCSR